MDTMRRITLYTLLIIANILCANLEASELSKVLRVDAKDIIQLYFNFDTPPYATTVENKRRIDLVFENTSRSQDFPLFEPDDRIVKILSRIVGDNFIVSLFFRYKPQKFSLTRSGDSQLVFEVLLGNEYSKSYQELAERLKGLTLLDRRVDDFSNPYLRSPYKNDWMSFFSQYESSIDIEIPVSFSQSPFPIIQFLPGVGKGYTDHLDESIIELANDKRWSQVATQILAKIRLSSEVETAKLLALSYGEALARNGDFEGAFKQLYLLKNRYDKELLGTYAHYLLLNLRAVFEEPHLANYEFRRLEKGIGSNNPLAPYLLLSAIETALASSDYQRMNSLLLRDDVGFPRELVDTVRIRHADYWYSIGQQTKAFAAYQLETGKEQLYSLPYSLSGYCNTLYAQKKYVEASRCYEELSMLVSEKEQLSMVLYRKNMAKLKYVDGVSLIDSFSHIENTFLRTEAAGRAALKRNDLMLLNDRSYAGKAIDEYTRISDGSSLRSIREEALFKKALLHSMTGDNTRAIALLHDLLREFQVGDVRMSAQALLIDILPAEIKRLVDSAEYLQALVLAKQNRDLFKNNWLDSTFLVDIAEAYNKIGIFDEAQKLYLYLIEISGADERERFFLPMVQATFDHGNYSLAEDYASQYVYNYPNGRFTNEIFLIRLKSLIADERLDEASKLLPDPIPEQADFLALAASLSFRQDEYQTSLESLERLKSLGVLFDEQQQFMYAESLFRSGLWQEAAESYQKISEQYSFYDQSLYRQAEIARKVGNDKKALRFLQDIVETGKRSRWTEFAERELQFIDAAKRF